MEEGAGNPRQIAASLQKLARVDHAKKRYTEAESCYQRALAIRQQVLGPGHPKVASTLYNLGRLYSDQGRWAKAEPLFQQSLTIVQEFFGPGHPKVTKRLSRLAMVYDGMGKYFEAAKIRELIPGDSDSSLKTELVGAQAWEED
jgi:tetratricopeptide (TPR) repeat protein